MVFDEVVEVHVLGLVVVTRMMVMMTMALLLAVDVTARLVLLAGRLSLTLLNVNTRLLLFQVASFEEL